MSFQSSPGSKSVSNSLSKMIAVPALYGWLITQTWLTIWSACINVSVVRSNTKLSLTKTFCVSRSTYDACILLEPLRIKEHDPFITDGEHHNVRQHRVALLSPPFVVLVYGFEPRAKETMATPFTLVGRISPQAVSSHLPKIRSNALRHVPTGYYRFQWVPSRYASDKKERAKPHSSHEEIHTCMSKTKGRWLLRSRTVW